MRTPDMTTNRCTLIIRLAPSSAVINFAATVLSKSTLLSSSLTNRSWCSSLTITLILRHLIEKYTPQTSRISQSEERDGKFEFTVRPSHLQRQLYEYNGQSAGGERQFLRIASSHTSLVGTFLLIDCKKIMRQPGRDQTAVPEIQLNPELKCRYTDRPTAERGPYSRGDFRAKPFSKRPESSKNR